MTTTGDTTAAESATRALTEAEEVARMARRPAFVIVRHTTKRFAIMGVVFAAIGWIAQWALGASITVPGLEVAPKGMPSFAGPLLTVLVAAMAGAVYGLVLVVFARRMAAGRMPIGQDEGPWIEVRPVWWARCIRDTAIGYVAIVLLGSVWFLGEWVQQGLHWPTRIDWDGVIPAIGIALFLAVLFAVGLLLSDIAEWALRRLKPFLMSSAALWWITCAVVGLLMAVFIFAALLGAAFLAHPFFVSLGLGPTRTLGPAVSLLLLAAWSGFDSARHQWGERETMQKDGAAAAGLSRSDFWNWNIEAQTSYSGIAPNGYPYYLWRESADNRLGLSRPRYCCITDREEGLFFTFFNPSENIRPTGGWAVFCGVAALVTIALLGSWWFDKTPRLPYHLDMTPPPFVVLVGTVLAASMMGAIIGGAWYVFMTLLRWTRDRFEGDGHLYTMPLRSLANFNMVHASEIGAQINGEKAKTGHGLTAAFDDGAMIILTGNAWNYPSIVAKHSNLTNAFREPRDKYLVEWEAMRKKAAREAETTSAAEPLAPRPRSAEDIPDRL